jgi:DNA-directed RNA polymerase specialized sigma24 family protein
MAFEQLIAQHGAMLYRVALRLMGQQEEAEDVLLQTLLTVYEKIDTFDERYYAGIICERKARAKLHQRTPRAGFAAYELLCEAMHWYEKAELRRSPDNDDATLRWNACVRLIKAWNLSPRVEERAVVTSE